MNMCEWSFTYSKTKQNRHFSYCAFITNFVTLKWFAAEMHERNETRNNLLQVKVPFVPFSNEQNY